jgi:hypothetical protein
MYPEAQYTIKLCNTQRCTKRITNNSYFTETTVILIKFLHGYMVTVIPQAVRMYDNFELCNIIFKKKTDETVPY